MTERQALHVVIDGIQTSRAHAALVTKAHARLVIYRTTDTERVYVTDTDSAPYAKGALLQFDGEILDRHDWKGINA